MPIFKKGIDTYDYTLLQKKGFLKKGEEKKSGVSVTKDGYFNLGSMQMPTPEPEQAPQAQAPSQENVNPLSFLDTFASPNPPTPEPPRGPTDIADVNVKLENLEYKLERLTEKLAEIELKLQEIGKN
jgi:hypothetical protein